MVYKYKHDILYLLVDSETELFIILCRVELFRGNRAEKWG